MLYSILWHIRSLEWWWENGIEGPLVFRPLAILTHPLAHLFTRMAKLAKDKHPQIQNLHFGLKPFLSKAWSKES